MLPIKLLFFYIHIIAFFLFMISIQSKVFKSIRFSNSIQRRLFAKKSLPSLSHDGLLELFHLRSFPRLITTSAGQFLIQSSGLAIRSSTNTLDVLVFEYQPLNYSAYFLPIITNITDNNTSNSNTINVIWDKRADVLMKNYLDIEYWQQSTFLAHINTVVYENFMKWIEIYSSSHFIYIPQSICSTADTTSCFTKSSTSDSFLTERYDLSLSLSLFLISSYLFIIVFVSYLN